MTKKLKNIISLTLVFFLMFPMTIKLLDGFFHHHDHFHCTAKNEKHFHEHHKKCPIPNFEFFLFIVKKHIPTTQKHFYCVKLHDNYHFIYCCNHSKYSFLLRAPPIFTNNTKKSLVI